MASRPANNVGRRGALGDLGNTLHALNHHDATANLKRNVLEPTRTYQKDVTKKTDLTKKIAPAISKENNLKINKENAAAKIPCRKPIRQESIIVPKNKILIPTSSRNTTLVQPKASLAQPKASLAQPKGSSLAQPKGSSLAQPKASLAQPKVSLAQPKPNLAQLKANLAFYDPDEKTKGDPLLVTEYVQDIMAHLRSLEDQFPIAEKFLEHSKVTPKMRTIVVNWLVDVHKNFSMGLETLYLSISILDRYLQANQAVDRNILQLVGTSALLLAGKYEEVYIPDLTDFVYICDDAFSKKQILQMEVDICKKLGFRMGWPIATDFLRRYSKVANAKQDHHNMAKYILESALLEYHLAHVRPSIQAAAASCLAMAIINEVMIPEKLWTPALAHYSKYKYADFKPVVHEFARMIHKADAYKYESVRQKYSASKFGKVSLSCKLDGPLIRKLAETK